MQLAHGAFVAVADGEKFAVFRNHGTEAEPQLQAVQHPQPGNDNIPSGGRHHSSAANPDDATLVEDGFAAATAAWLNSEVLDGRIKSLVVIAAPKTLGELRKHYHKALEAVLHGELSKDLTGHSTADIEKALAAA
jgi:protein required for attachment to host cells